MTATTSTDTYPLTVGGRQARTVDPDPAVHTSETEGRFWSPSPFVPGQNLEWGDGAHLRPTVVQHEPEERPAVPASAPTAPAPRRAKGAPRKLEYAETLAGGRPDLTDAEYRLLMAMWRYADNTTLGDIFPGHARLAEHVGLAPTKNNRDSVGRRIGSLIRKGYVVKVREGTTVPHRRAAEYRLTLPEWEGSAEPTAVSGTR